MPTGTSDNAGPADDDTVEAIKAAIQAEGSPSAPETGDDSESGPILFPVITATGIDGFEEIMDFVERLKEAGKPLFDPQTWQDAGLRNAAHLKQISSVYALDAAKAYYDRAQFKKGMVFNVHTIKNHPAYDYEGAAAYLFKTNARLFSDRSYDGLGGSMVEFFNGMQKAYADLVHQNARVAGAMLDANEDDEKALGLIENIRGRCFERLGIVKLDDEAANLTGLTEGELETIEYRAIRACVRARLKQTIPLRWKDRNGQEYCHAVLNAWEAARQNMTVLDDATTFEGTNFTRRTLQIEAERVVDILIQEPLTRLEGKAGEIDVEELHTLIENLEHWRSLFDEVEAPEDVHPEQAEEDFWNAEILDQFGYRSFSHMMDCLSQVYGASLANNTMNNRDTMAPADVYDNLMEAREALERGGVSFDRIDAFEQIQLDREEFFRTLDETAPAAIDRFFNESYYPGLPCKIQLEYLSNAMEALNRIFGTPSEGWMSAPAGALEAAERKAVIRKAEEHLAMSRIVCVTQGLYSAMKPAVEMLDDIDLTLTSREFQGRTGMSADTAQALAKEYNRSDMMSLWNAATDPDEDALQRLSDAIEFEERLDKMDGADHFETLVLVEKDWEDHQAHLGQIGAEALKAAVERMQEVPNDTLSHAQFIKAIRDALNLISPDTMAHPAVFKRFTNYDLARFLEMEKDTDERVDYFCKPDMAAFNISRKKVVRRLRDVRDMKRGAHGWMVLRNLRHDATVTGFSIGDDDILNAARMNFEDLNDLAYQHAVGAARTCIDTACAREPGALSLHDLRPHAYNDYAAACKWLERSGINTLADDVYKDMGLTGRADFVERMRESLFDYMLQIETAIVREGVTTVGPFTFLYALETLRNTYQVLGFDNERDESSDMPHDFVPNAVNVETTRLGIRKFRAAACLSVLNSDSSPAAKLRKLRQVLDFGRRMQVDIPDDAKTMEWNTKFMHTVQARLNTVMDNFAKKPDDMARGWRVARAIDQVRTQCGLDRFPWFDEIFQRLGYGNFTVFCEDMAIKRLDQIRRRCDRRHIEADVDTLGTGAHNRDMLEDIGRMQEVIESPLLRPERVTTVMDFAKVTREWIAGYHRNAAILALPLLNDFALDPAMSPAEREAIIVDVFKMREVAGSEDKSVKRLNWEQMNTVHVEMIALIASQCLLHDMMRAETRPTWSPALLRVYSIMEEIGMDMGDETHLQALGLSDEEAKGYAKLAPLALPYTLILKLEKMSDKSFNHAYNVVLGIFAHAQQNGIDLTDWQVQRTLGIRTNAEMQQLLVKPTLYLARSLSSSVKNADDAAYGNNVGTAMLKFLEATGLEKLVEPRVLEENDILDGRALAGFMRKFEQMTAGGQRPAVQAPV